MQNLFFVTFSIIFPVFISAYQGTIFPKPVNLQLGTEVTYLSKDFKFNQIQESQSVLLANAIDRYEKLINVEQSPSDLSPSSTTQIKECSINVTQVITRSEHTSHIIQLTLERRSLAIDSDYSHTLQVNDKDGSCVITANTIWGAMYAMESFTHQLVRESTSHYKKRRSLRSGGSSGGEHDEDKEHDHIGHDHKHDNKNHDNKNNKDKDEDKDEDEDEDEDGDESSSDVFYIYCNNTSLYVSDSSRFSHRGLLLDSARHYLPLSQVRSVIDTLPMNKMNILHWHLSDAQSCPLALTSTPDMIKGAWNPTAIYTDKDIKHINDYAADRGVYVLFEIDVPGHTGAWRFGYPELMADCLQKYTNVNDYAVNPTLPAVYDLLTNLLESISDATSTTHFHLGGDEVIYSCWSNDVTIVNWMKQNQVASYDELLSYFVKKADGIVQNMKAVPIHWEEVFFAVKNTKNSTYALDMNTLIQVWTNAANVASVTADGYKVIASPSSVWYANYLTITWQTMYTYDPTAGLSTTQASLVQGGEVCLWGETVDNTNLESVLYPRAYTASERLWSPATVVDQVDALYRMEIHRCRMLQRGFTPAPFDPSTCNVLYV